MRRYPAPTIHPHRGSLPVLISVPHAGRDYDDDLLANAAHGRPSLELLEDPLVDRLCWRATAAGIATIIQNCPRAAIDCNRGEEEVDPASVAGIPAPIGARARQGLGLVPSRTHRHGSLWRRPVALAELHRRIDQIHRPYHRALEGVLDELRCRYGGAILIDCHSMPTRSGGANELVIGDRHGRSSAAWLSREAAALSKNAGFRVAMNEPYAGGAIISRHGKPEKWIHALQLEIDRATYLKRDGRTPGPGFDRVSLLIEALAMALGEALLGRQLGIAAE